MMMIMMMIGQCHHDASGRLVVILPLTGPNDKQVHSGCAFVPRFKFWRHDSRR